MSVQVLVADASGEWCASLVAALGEDGNKVKTSASGTELEAALADPQLRVIVVGEGLSDQSSFDALFRASQKTSANPGAVRAIVLMLLDVRHDIALMELIRSRGVKGFVRRDAPIEEVAAQVRSCLYVDSRVANREFLKAKGTLELDGERVTISIEDLSNGGALVVGSARKLKGASVGSTALLSANIYEVELSVPVVVRRIELRKALLGDQLAFGVSFAELEFAQRQAVETILECVVSARKGEYLDLNLHPPTEM